MKVAGALTCLSVLAILAACSSPGALPPPASETALAAASSAPTETTVASVEPTVTATATIASPEPTPTATPSPSLTPTSTPTATPTLDYARFVDSWKTYRNEKYGFTFEYPAIYDEPPFARSCAVREDPNGVYVGERTDVLFLDPQGLDLEQYVANWARDCQCTEEGIEKGECDCWIEAQSDTVVDGLPAITVDYRFGGLNRFGTFTMVEHGGHIFAFELTAGAFCDVDEIRLRELDVYDRLIRTFHFLN